MSPQAALEQCWILVPKAVLEQRCISTLGAVVYPSLEFQAFLACLAAQHRLALHAGVCRCAHSQVAVLCSCPWRAVVTGFPGHQGT